MEFPWKKPYLVLLAATVLLAQASGSNGCFKEEKEALLDFKAAYVNESSLPSWVDDPKANCCAWDRVTCDSSSAHVTHLSLRSLYAHVDPGFDRSCSHHTPLNWSLFLTFKEITTLDLSNNCFDAILLNHENKSKSTLKKLETLDLTSNYLNESIMELASSLPSLKNFILRNNDIGEPFYTKDLSLLRNLEQLDLSFNNLSSFFTPQVLANLSKLEVLKVSDSSIVGSFPYEGLCKMKKLQELDLARNHFRGTLDICLGNLTSLQRLDLSDNLLIGSIPTNFPNQTSLRYFDLSGSNLVGMFPNWLFENNPKLEVVHLNNNSFTGPFELPFDLNHKMEITDLDLSNNQIQGKLPSNIGFLIPHLKNLDVSGNKFDGHIPDSIVEMSSLIGLFLRDNNFSGKIPEHIFNRCTQLNYLMIDNNHLNGTIPDGIGKLNPAILTASLNNLEGAITKEFCNLDLDILDLRHNKFSGELPPCLKMPWHYLFLQGNSFSGTINEALINSSSQDIEAIDLSDNKFTGTIPESMYGLKSLRFLLLAGNQLHGQLSSKLCQLQNIDILDLSRNSFTGSIPSCLNNNSFGKTYFSSHYDPGVTLTPFKTIPDFTEVQLVTKGFSLSYKGATLEYMSGLYLSSNQLTGKVPHQIGDLFALRALNLSHNYLSGPIPESFQKLESIESLDLSNNNLSGQIPLHLEDLHSLAVFNVSYNNLSGKAPDKGQFGTFDETSYRGNPNLTWSNSNRGNATSPLPPMDDGSKNSSAIDFTAFYWSFAASYVMVLVVSMMILWINPKWRREWFCFVQRCCHKCFADAFY